MFLQRESRLTFHPVAAMAALLTTALIRLLYKCKKKAKRHKTAYNIDIYYKVIVTTTTKSRDLEFSAKYAKKGYEKEMINIKSL